MQSIVSFQWLYENLNKPGIIILDTTLVNQRAKQPESIKKLQITNARYFDIKQKFSDSSNEFPSALPPTEQFENECQLLGINTNSTIIVYDANGIYSCARVWWLFKTFGHTNVSVLNGGLPNWKNHDLPTEELKLNTKYSKGNFKAKLNSILVRKFKDVFNNLKTKQELVIDVRSSDRFNCLVPEPKEGLRKGTIPNSINIPYTDVLKNGKFKSKKELTPIFRSLLNEKRSIVFSCGSGITACIVLLAAQQVIENNLAVYDGSWTEWGSLVKKQ